MIFHQRIESAALRRADPFVTLTQKIKQSQNQIKAARGPTGGKANARIQGRSNALALPVLARPSRWTQSAVFAQGGEPTRDCVLVAILTISTGRSAGHLGCRLEKVAEYHLCSHSRTKLITFLGKTKCCA